MRHTPVCLDRLLAQYTLVPVRSVVHRFSHTAQATVSSHLSSLLSLLTPRSADAWMALLQLNMNVFNDVLDWCLHWQTQGPDIKDTRMHTKSKQFTVLVFRMWAFRILL